MSDAREFSPIRWTEEHLELLDQTLLPGEERWLVCRAPEEVGDAIRRLAVRGAPAIGVAAAFGAVLGLAGVEERGALLPRYDAVAAALNATRPTAVNLRWALERGRQRLAAELAHGGDTAAIRAALWRWAQGLWAEDVRRNRAIGEAGKTLFRPGDRVLTHCNAGALATAGFGTAVGVIHAAWQSGCVRQVWVDETRPLLQGARLTAWEMARLGIPYRVLPDSAAATLLARGEVERIVVGADRIARNGDTANKVGTYPLAVVAHRHGVPFYIAAPTSTVDPRISTGAEIPIEERAAEEVTTLAGRRLAPAGAAVFNPAFDVTPHELIAAIVTERGVVLPPFDGLGELAETAGDTA